MRLAGLDDRLQAIDLTTWGTGADLLADFRKEDWEAIRAVAQVSLGYLREMEELCGETASDIARSILSMWDVADARIAGHG